MCTGASPLSSLKKVLFPFNFIEKDKPRRNTMHSRSDWYEEEMRNVDQVNEELMVIYYSTILILYVLLLTCSINKNQDALKSVSRYMKKSNISQISLANLYKIHAFLLMISIDYSVCQFLQYLELAVVTDVFQERTEIIPVFESTQRSRHLPAWHPQNMPRSVFGTD